MKEQQEREALMLQDETLIQKKQQTGKPIRTHQQFLQDQIRFEQRRYEDLAQLM
jgi:hypothetical protein